MSRNPMQDIVPKGRSIRNVPLPANRTKAAIKKEEKLVAAKEASLRKDIDMKEEADTKLKEDIIEEREELEEDVSRREALRQAREEFEQTRAKPSRRGGRRNIDTKWYRIGGIVVGVLVVAFVIASIFHSATVTVKPHTQSFVADTDITALRAPAEGTSGSLSFTTLDATETASETVAATGQKQVDTRASGIIVIYNNYSSAAQRLIRNTRFETPEGLIYRISDSVTVPGKKGSVPGSVEATVLADASGANYNVGLKDFTIPGFKGDPRYAGFYARSKTPLAGGFSGIQKIVADADRAKAKADIEAKLAAQLVKDVAAKKASNQTLFDKAYVIDYAPLPDEASGNNVTIKEQGSITAAVFDQEALSAALASSYATGYKNEPIMVQNIGSLAFTPKDFRPDASNTITFHLSGSSTFEWLFDETALKNALKGQARANVPAILQRFPMIERADISIRPFWSHTFPSSIDKITIKKGK